MTERRTAIQVAKEAYSSLPELRAAIQLIPVVGGSIDTLIVGRLGQLQAARIEHLIACLTARLSGLEKSTTKVESEGFADLVVTTFEKSARARSASKRERFANILAKQVISPTEWEEPEAAVRLLADLEDVHIKILTAALHAPKCDGVFVGLQVVAVSGMAPGEPSKLPPMSLPDALPEYSAVALRLASAELVARSLLHDEGVGRWETRSLEYLVPTDVAKWFEGWISPLNS